uniref:Uncharacterized protein LOC100180157 n=1 Tax=Phallusia mammillata TaxID=59560 RepID=A0A6F9DGL6_9ASCI|nr:uncharacterized protein LOC100180157 [Phallusia mammillata]
MSENSTGVKPRSESRHKNSKSSTSVNVPASSYKSARNDTKTSPKSRKKDTTENTFARERVEQDKTSLKQEKVETEILPDSTTSPADNNAPRQASPMKDTLDKLVNVIQALLNQGSSNGTEKDNKKVMSPTLETNRSTTFHVNFDVSSPKVEPSNALKLPGNFQPTFSSLLLPDVDECYSPTSSYSPCSDTEKVPLADSERTKENIPNWPKDTNMLNSDQKSSGFSEASCSEQTKEQHITTNLPSNIEMSFWPSSPIRIEFIENDTVEAILKAPVCQKCICDNAHLNGIKDPRSQNQKYIRYFTLWHMCCLCLESKGATEKFRMCTLPDSISGPTSNISKLINEEALPPKDTVVHEQIPKLQSINTHQSLLQTECLRIKAMTEEQTNNNQKVDEKKNDCITLSRSKTASTSAAGTSESGNQNFSGSERTLTSIPFTSDNIQHSEIPTTSYEQDTPYYYNINYFNEKKTSICEYESPTEEETFIPPEPSTPTGSDEDLPKKESQDPQEIIPAAVDEVTKVTQLQEIESGSISPPVTKSMLDQNSKLLNSNKPTGNNLLVSAIHQAVTSKSSSNLCKSLSSGASGSYKHYPVHTSSETAAESSDDPVSCLFGHFQGYAPSLLNNLPESSSSNTQNNESSSSDGPSLKPWSRKRNLAKLVYSDLSSDSDGERANKRKFEITKTTRTVEMASTKTGLKPNFTPSKSNSTEKLVLVEKNNSATNPPQLSSFAAHDATSEKLKPNTAKSIFSETSDIFDSTANEETDYQPVHTESSHDWSNPEWLDVEIPQLSRPKRRRTTFKNKSRETDTKQLKAKTCVARSQSTSESTKTNLTDRKVPFKKRRFSDLSVEKPLQEWITDADQWQSPATKTRLDLNQAKQNVRNDDNDRGGKSNKTSDQTTTKGVDDQISVCTSEPEITAESEAFAQETMDDECTDSSSTKTVSTETEQNETFTLAQPCIAECKHFYVKGKPYAWPYTYPTLSQIDALSDSDDSEKYTSAHFYKPYIFLKRLEEDGYVPECFVKDMAHHQCCLCCTSYCCSTPWVSIENVKLVD